MRYLIELLDDDPMENIVGTCAFVPEVVVFLCDRRDRTFFKESAIYRLLRQRKLKTTPRFYYFDTDSTAQIRRVLAAVVRDYPGCVFDFTGGKDLLLVEAGAFCVPRDIPCYYINLRQRRFLNIHACEKLEQGFQLPVLTAENLFTAYGAAVLGSGHYGPGELDADFEKCIVPIWEMVSENPRAWDDFVGWLQKVCHGTPLSRLEVRLPDGSWRQQSRQALLHRLAGVGVLQFSAEGKEALLCFSSTLYKKTLLNQGIWLELFGYLAARESKLFTDVHTSVVIDWDGAESHAGSTKNEVDIFVMKDIVPLFISCKMGLPSALGLSEIKLLAVKFGGKLSRAVLLTAATLGSEHRALRGRAADLGITLVDMTDIRSGKLARILESAALSS